MNIIDNVGDEKEVSRPNPNDNLFADFERDEPYQLKSTYTSVPAKKSGVSPIVVLVVLAMIAAVVVGINQDKKKKEKELRRFDGTYVVTELRIDGLYMDPEKFELLTGVSFEGIITIDGKKGYVKIDMKGKDSAHTRFTEGNVEVKLDGDNITLVGPGGDLHYTYVHDDNGDYITYEYDGCVWIYTKQN